MGDRIGIQRPVRNIYLSLSKHHGQLSHPSSWGRLMSSKLNSGVRYAYMHGGAAWERLRVKADMVLFAGYTV